MGTVSAPATGPKLFKIYLTRISQMLPVASVYS
jgi:hypothetical protein